MRIELPFPSKLLWPNGSRGTHKAVSGQKKRHREWAHYATLDAIRREGWRGLGDAPLPVTIHVHAKPKGPLPDRDNCIAAAKSLLDGIADALKINDRDFATPQVAFALPRDGRFVIEVGAGAAVSFPPHYPQAIAGGIPYPDDSGPVDGLPPDEQEAA